MVLVSAFFFPSIAAGAEGTFSLDRVAADEWRAEYCFAQPVNAMKFTRPFEGLRESSWQIGEAFELVFEDGTAELRHRDGEDFRCATVALRTYTVLPDMNYYAFSPFSDGGVSLYTGYLIASIRVDGVWREADLDARYVGREDEQVITRDPKHLVEQFVYFGRQPVFRSDGVIAVIDPAMPDQARRGILEAIPAVNRMLAVSFGFRPASPYMIFMATELDASDGYSIKGGALEGQIEFMLKGRGVIPLVEKHPTHFPKTTAHEMIHLWQNDQWFGSLGSDQPWVHEGSAEALAFEIAHDTGIYADEKYRDAWKAMETECIGLLKKSSIHAGMDSGNSDIAYSCGALMNRLVGEAINPADPGAGIVRFWQAMAAWPEHERKLDSEKLYFMTLKKLGFAEEQREALRKFLDMQTEEPEKVIMKLRETLAGKE